jgi:hypothetical protein
MCKRKRHNERHDDLTGAIMIRVSRAGDAEGLRRLAGLECRTLPEGSFLVAEVNGELVAAAPIDVDAGPLANPFLATADLCEFLGLRARRLRERHHRRTYRMRSRAVAARAAA